MLGKTNVKVKPNKKVQYVDYIESTGTQYIDTGVISVNTIRTEIEFELTSVIASGSTGIVGAYDGSTSPYKGLLLGLNNGSLQFAYGGGWNGSSSTPSLENKYEAVINNANKQCTLNGTVLVSTSSLTSNYTVNKTSYIFWTHGGTANKVSMKLYSCKMYDGETLIRDFKPCKDGAGVYCMYDEVEKRYYYNQGSGEFTGGDSV